MNPGKTIFAQLLQQISHYQFRKIVDHYKGSHRVRSFSCRDQFIAMAFAQLTGRDSLRDIESCLSSHREKLYHMGLRSPISRSTLADIYRQRWHVELFFKWVKQHLRIKAFFGTSANAVKTQVWIAIIAYLSFNLRISRAPYSRNLAGS